MGILLAVTLPLIILAYVAYYFFAPGPESDFFKNFSLDNVLSKTLPAEIDYPSNVNTAVSNRINLAYESGKIQGNIRMSGKWESGFYLLTADLEERRKRWRFAKSFA